MRNLNGPLMDSVNLNRPNRPYRRVNKARVTPSDIQYSAATQIWGCYRLVSRAKVIENQPVAPPSPDYIPSPEEPQTPPVPHDEDEREPMFLQPHDPDYVPEPMYPNLEDGPIDYPMEGGDDRDDDDGNSFRDDADDGDKDEEEEEEHLAPADSAVIVPLLSLFSHLRGTKPITPSPSTNITTTGARITVRIQASISLPPEAEVERLLAMPTPPPLPLTSLPPPSAG
ncbi:hypothetical protein Tco_0268291 [Tanacetum coccineum]